MKAQRVFLLGGTPMTGKSTLARKLAARLEYGCLSTDDLGQAIGAVTTAHSHPAFHEMDGIDYREYYVSRSLDELIADAECRHTTLWPAIARVITAHAGWGGPVGDGRLGALSVAGGATGLVQRRLPLAGRR